MFLGRGKLFSGRLSFRKHKAVLSDENVCAPLAWPDNWKKTSPAQRVFMGMPFVGLDRRIFRAFKQKLEHRDESIYNLWTGDLKLCASDLQLIQSPC
jgi:hypothetical protein